ENTTDSSRNLGSRPGKTATTLGASTRLTSLFKSSEAVKFNFTGLKSRDAACLRNSSRFRSARAIMRWAASSVIYERTFKKGVLSPKPRAISHRHDPLE